MKLQPLLPRPLAAPFRLLPDTAHSPLIAGALNRVLAEPLCDGELDFLQDCCVAIAGLNFNVFAGTFFIEVETGKMPCIGVVAEPYIDGVGAVINGGLQRWQVAGRADQLP